MGRFILPPAGPRGAAGKALKDNFLILDNDLTACADAAAAVMAAQTALDQRIEDAGVALGNVSDLLEPVALQFSSIVSDVRDADRRIDAAEIALGEIAASVAEGNRLLDNIPSYRIPADWLVYQSGTNYVVEDKNGQVVRSTSDPHTALQHAFALVIRNGGCLYIKAGMYQVSSPIVCPGDVWSAGNALICGDGGTTIRLSNPNTSLFVINNNQNNLTFRDITLDGGYTGNDRSSHALIAIYYSYNILIERVRFINAIGNAIAFPLSPHAKPTTRVRNVIISDCIFERIALSPISATGVRNLVVRNCRFINTCRNPYTTGLAAAGDVYTALCANVISSGNSHKTGGANMVPINYNIAATHTRDSVSVVVRECVIDDHRSQGMLISMSPYSVVCNNTITRTKDANNRYYGYAAAYIESTLCCVVSGNSISGSNGAIMVSAETLVDHEGYRRVMRSDMASVRENTLYDVYVPLVVAGHRCLVSNNTLRDVGYRHTISGIIEAVTDTTVTVLLPPIAGEPESYCGFGYFQGGDICDMWWTASGQNRNHRGMSVSSCTPVNIGGQPNYSRVVLLRGTGDVPTVNSPMEISNRQRNAAMMFLGSRLLVHHNAISFQWPFGEEPYVNCNHTTNKLNQGNNGLYVKYGDNEFTRQISGQYVFMWNLVEYAKPNEPTDNLFVNNRPTG